MENENLTPLTEEEQKTILKELLGDDLSIATGGSIFLFILFAVLNFETVTSWSTASVFNIALLVLTSIGLLAIYTRIFYGYIRKYLNFKKGRYTYHYLDVDEYRPGSSLNYEVYYSLNGSRKYVSTQKYGVTKVHVFECGGDPLATIDEKSCK